MNNTPKGNRVHIGFFGKRNAGKSSVVNAVTNQELAVVSEVKGTTTDPVYKAMELLPMGPVMIIDTAGIDDSGDLGELRIKKTQQVLNKTDIAVLVVDVTEGLSTFDTDLIEKFKDREIPYIVAYNKCDIAEINQLKDNEIKISATSGEGINELKERIASLTKKEEKQIVGDLLKPNDLVVLVVPIDSAAPKGRLILPQQQTIRDILDSGAMAVVARESELTEILNSLSRKPRMVITDSQVFGKVKNIVPEDLPLTSFSILMARYKGFLNTAVNGADALDSLNNGDTVLISEGCTHHRQCDDIGSVKLPKWLKEYTGKDINIEFSSGTEFPEDLSRYKVVIHCGGCMLNEKEVLYRMKTSVKQNIPFTNYGIAIAKMKGILKRSIAPLNL